MYPKAAQNRACGFAASTRALRVRRVGPGPRIPVVVSVLRLDRQSRLTWGSLGGLREKASSRDRRGPPELSIQSYERNGPKGPKRFVCNPRIEFSRGPHSRGPLTAHSDRWGPSLHTPTGGAAEATEQILRLPQPSPRLRQVGTSFTAAASGRKANPSGARQRPVEARKGPVGSRRARAFAAEPHAQFCAAFGYNQQHIYIYI